MGPSITLAIALLASLPVCIAAQGPTKQDHAAVVDFAQQAAIRAVNFHEGDAASLKKARADFTVEGWNDFMKHMQGWLDANGGPTFNSSFVPSKEAVFIGERDGIVHLRIPGTLKQTQNQSSTTYRAALDVYAGGNPVKLHHVEQIMCAGRSTACR